MQERIGRKHIRSRCRVTMLHHSTDRLLTWCASWLSCIGSMLPDGEAEAAFFPFGLTRILAWQLRHVVICTFDLHTTCSWPQLLVWETATSCDCSIMVKGQLKSQCPWSFLKLGRPGTGLELFCNRCTVFNRMTHNWQIRCIVLDLTPSWSGGRTLRRLPSGFFWHTSQNRVKSSLLT